MLADRVVHGEGCRVTVRRLWGHRLSLCPCGFSSGFLAFCHNSKTHVWGELGILNCLQMCVKVQMIVCLYEVATFPGCHCTFALWQLGSASRVLTELSTENGRMDDFPFCLWIMVTKENWGIFFCHFLKIYIYIYYWVFFFCCCFFFEEAVSRCIFILKPPKIELPGSSATWRFWQTYQQMNGKQFTDLQCGGENVRRI